MFGDEDTEDAGTADQSGVDVRQLANDAEGASVTASRLRGDEEYFPDCRPFLHEGQRPHHLILLTTSGWAFRADAGSSSHDLSGTSTGGGVAICTGDELLVVVDDDFCEVPYANLQGILTGFGTIRLHGLGNTDYYLDVAKSADEDEVNDAIDCLRQKVRAAAAATRTADPA